MIKGRKIAIIVRGSEHLGEVPGIIRGFKGISQYIQVFLVCCERLTDERGVKAAIDSLSDCGAACFVDESKSAQKFGFRYTTIEEMAPMLRMFDAVIPI